MVSWSRAYRTLGLVASCWYLVIATDLVLLAQEPSRNSSTATTKKSDTRPSASRRIGDLRETKSGPTGVRSPIPVAARSSNARSNPSSQTQSTQTPSAPTNTIVSGVASANPAAAPTLSIANAPASPNPTPSQTVRDASAQPSVPATSASVSQSTSATNASSYTRHSSGTGARLNDTASNSSQNSTVHNTVAQNNVGSNAIQNPKQIAPQENGNVHDLISRFVKRAEPLSSEINQAVDSASQRASSKSMPLTKRLSQWNQSSAESNESSAPASAQAKGTSSAERPNFAAMMANAKSKSGVSAAVAYKTDASAVVPASANVPLPRPQESEGKKKAESVEELPKGNANVNTTANGNSNSSASSSGSGSGREKTSRREMSLPIGSAMAELLPNISNKKLDTIQFDDLALSEAMRVFADQSGLNIITSTDAGKIKLTVFLKNVTAVDALEAIVKANGLFYRVEQGSGIVRIATLKEYEKDLASFREEQTRVFTLLYPNPSAVAQVIQQVFGNRVELNKADADSDDMMDLSYRFSRFDMVDGRSLGLGSSGGGNAGGGGGGGGGGAGVAGNNTMQSIAPPSTTSAPKTSQQRAADAAARRKQMALNDLSADEIQMLENRVAEEGDIGDEQRADLFQRRDATIYISTIRRNNQVIVRTGDARSMEQIAQLIAQLDVPTPTVLLEVKVLRIVLGNGFNSAFEYLGKGDKTAATISDGALAPTFPGGTTVARQLASGLGVAGGVPGSLTFQMVDNDFRVRMQVLESKNCVTALATPIILTANNEVSRIFVGDTLPFTIGFTPSQVLSSGVGAVAGAVAATPITEMRDVGQSLLITPNINADRTVTLRVVEENSERVLAGSSIPVPSTTGTGVANVNVDTVRRRTISGTVVAQDGMAVAMGGLIEENDSNARDQVPVLGDIPGLGILFRRQAINRSRSELVVIVRPYVFNTPSESAATTELLLGEMSTHPGSMAAIGDPQRKLPCRVTRSDAECSQRAKLFQLSGSGSSF